MTCEQKGCQREATVFFTLMVNGVMQKQAFCQQCADEQGIMDAETFSLEQTLFTDDHMEKTTPSSENTEQDLCPKCRFTLEKFHQIGRMGCPECYETFSDQVTQKIKTLHTGTTHNGYSPPKKIQKFKRTKHLKELQEELQKVIATEDFEKAAQLRDQIQTLEQEQ